MENTSPLSYHYFRVTVTDTFDYQTKGSIYSTSLDPIPDSVDVDTVTYDLEKMTVKWGESKESDFSSYKLLYSKTESGDRDTIETYTDKTTTTYSTTTYDPTHENWYWVMVTDTLGQSKIGIGKSNKIDPPPKKVNMNEVIFDHTTTPITMLVNWLDIWVEDHWDYKEHRLLYSQTESGSRDTIKTYTVKTTNNYSTTEFDPTHENWYFVEVIDHWGQSSISDGKTHNKLTPPKPPQINSVSYNLEKMSVTWDTGSSPWFKEYRVLYSSTKEGLKDTVKIITDISPGEYSTTTFDPTKENWYFIQEFDIYGQSSISEGKTNEIDPLPTNSTITIVEESISNFKITWSENIDNDFSSYKLYQSTSKDMSGKSLIKEYTNKTDTQYSKSNVTQDSKLYYQIITSDKWGQESSSNINYISTLERIIYTSQKNRVGEEDIIMIDIDGDVIKELTDYGYNNNPMFSSDGKSIVYDYGKGDNVIYKMDFNGLNKKQLISSGTLHSFPLFSSDGSKVIYTSDKTYGSKYIYTIDVNGDNDTKISSLITDYNKIYEGNGKIIYKSISPNNYGLYIIDLDGTNETKLLDNDPPIVNVDISKDGSKIIYLEEQRGSEHGGKSDLFIMDKDGSNKLRLTTTTDRYENYPRFTPQGNRIIYVSDVYDFQGRTGSELILMDLDGENKSVLFSSQSILRLPQVSSDGEDVVFFNHRNSSYPDIDFINYNGTGHKIIVKEIKYDGTPSFTFQPR